jgi:hypothetical protein
LPQGYEIVDPAFAEHTPSKTMKQSSSNAKAYYCEAVLMSQTTSGYPMQAILSTPTTPHPHVHCLNMKHSILQDTYAATNRAYLTSIEVASKKKEVRGCQRKSRGVDLWTQDNSPLFSRAKGNNRETQQRNHNRQGTAHVKQSNLGHHLTEFSWEKKDQGLEQRQ